MVSPKTGKGWTDRVVIVNGETLRLKRLQNVGNSLALLIPKIWIEFMCKPDENGKIFVSVKMESNQIIVTGYKEKK